MFRDPFRRQSLGGWLLGWMFTLLMLALLAQVLVAMIRPLLLWIGLALVIALPTVVVLRRWWRGF